MERPTQVRFSRLSPSLRTEQDDQFRQASYTNFTTSLCPLTRLLLPCRWRSLPHPHPPRPIRFRVIPIHPTFLSPRQRPLLPIPAHIPDLRRENRWPTHPTQPFLRSPFPRVPRNFTMPCTRLRLPLRLPISCLVFSLQDKGTHEVWATWACACRDSPTSRSRSTQRTTGG